MSPATAGAAGSASTTSPGPCHGDHASQGPVRPKVPSQLADSTGRFYCFGLTCAGGRCASPWPTSTSPRPSSSRIPAHFGAGLSVTTGGGDDAGAREVFRIFVDVLTPVDLAVRAGSAAREREEDRDGERATDGHAGWSKHATYQAARGATPRNCTGRPGGICPGSGHRGTSRRGARTPRMWPSTRARTRAPRVRRPLGIVVEREQLEREAMRAVARRRIRRQPARPDVRVLAEQRRVLAGGDRAGLKIRSSTGGRCVTIAWTSGEGVGLRHLRRSARASARPRGPRPR